MGRAYSVWVCTCSCVHVSAFVCVWWLECTSNGIASLERERKLLIPVSLPQICRLTTENRLERKTKWLPTPRAWNEWRTGGAERRRAQRGECLNANLGCVPNIPCIVPYFWPEPYSALHRKWGAIWVVAFLFTVRPSVTLSTCVSSWHPPRSVSFLLGGTFKTARFCLTIMAQTYHDELIWPYRT